MATESHHLQLPPDFLAFLLSKEPSARVEGLKLLEADLRDGIHQWPGVTFQQLMAELLESLSDVRVDVCISTLGCIGTLCESQPRKAQAELPRIINALCDTLAHQHIQVQESVSLCLDVLAQSASLDAVIAQVVMSGIENPSSQVRQQTLLFLQRCAEYGETQAMTLLRHLVKIVLCTGDTDTGVKRSAMQLLEQLQRTTGVVFDDFMEQVRDMHPDAAESVVASLKAINLHGPSTEQPGTPESVHSSSSAGSKTLGKAQAAPKSAKDILPFSTADEGPDYDIGLTAPILGEAPLLVNNEKDLAKEIETLQDLLKDTKVDWERRTEGLKRLWKLIEGGATEMKNFIPLLNKLKLALVCQAYDLRSRVPKIACQILSTLAFRLGDEFEPFADYFFPYMLKNISNSVTVIKESANSCIRSFLFKMRSVNILRKIVEQSSPKNSKDKNTRLRCQEYLYLILTEWQAPILEKNLDLLEEQIRYGIVDADEKTRQVARKSFIRLQRVSTDRVTKILNSLDPPLKRILSEELQKQKGIINEGNRTTTKPSQKTEPRKQLQEEHGSTLGAVPLSSQPSGAPSLKSSFASRKSTTSMLIGGAERVDPSQTQDGDKDRFGAAKRMNRPTSPQAGSLSGPARRVTTDNFVLNTPLQSTSKSVRPSSLTIDLSQVVDPNKSPSQPTAVQSARATLESTQGNTTGRKSVQTTLSSVSNTRRSVRGNESSVQSLPSTPVGDVATAMDIVQIMAVTNSAPWATRVQAYHDLQRLIKGPKCADLHPHLDRLANMYIDRLSDPHPKALVALIDSLDLAIQTFSTRLEAYLDKILFKLLDKTLDPNESIRQSCDFVLRSVQKKFPPDNVLVCCIRLLDSTNQRVKITVLQLFIATAPQATAAMSNPSNMKAIVQKLVPLLNERVADVKEGAVRAMALCQTLNPTQFQSQVALLNVANQELVKKSLAKSTEVTGNQKSPSSRASSPRPPERKATPTRSVRGFPEQPLPRSPVTSSANVSGISSDPPANDLQTATALNNHSFHSPVEDGIRNMNVDRHSHGSQIPLSAKALTSEYSQSPAHSPSMIPMPNSRRIPSPSSKSVSPASRSNPSNPTHAFAREDSQLPRGPANTQPKYDPREYATTPSEQQARSPSGAKPVLVATQGDHGPVKAIIQALSSSVMRQEGLHRLLRLSRDPSNAVWRSHFSILLGAVLDTLQDTEPTTRELSVHVLKEMMLNQKPFFSDSVGVLLDNLLACSRDPSREVVTAAEDSFDMLPEVLPAELCFEHLIITIGKEPPPVLQLAIRALSKTFASLSVSYLQSKLPYLIPPLFQSFVHDAPDVRKAVVYALVDLYKCLGSDLEPYFETLSGTQRKLVQLYISRMANH
eukprot:TRINITY_DN7287_c0_g1_i1.p1 TRINITY_DN7287_c0_g1~~TRINITY_DN7287_c0_g1_i1.p1  ORF type:complete len:1366 (-),score=285.51 TRINITY_DN7287_c0_g1_i1:467-4564(-)